MSFFCANKEIPVLRDDFVSIYYQRCPLDRFRKRELLHEGGRATIVNKQRFIHAIVPRQPVIKQGIKDGTIRTNKPAELAQMLFLTLNIWVNPMVFPASNTNRM